LQEGEDRLHHDRLLRQPLLEAANHELELGGFASHSVDVRAVLPIDPRAGKGIEKHRATPLLVGTDETAPPGEPPPGLRSTTSHSTQLVPRQLVAAFRENPGDCW